MTSLLDRSDQALSVTDFTRSAKSIIDGLVAGERNKYVMMRNNHPAAVLVNVQHYEALLAEIEDLKIQFIARERLKSFDPSEAISHEEMLRHFDSNKD
ncbi:MAG: hypothetical protein ABFQ95_06885 [Pseudomonadota bacterium]